MQAKKFVFTLLLMVTILAAGCQPATPQAPAVQPTTPPVEQPTQAPAPTEVVQPTQAPPPTEAPKPTEPPAPSKKVVTFLWTQEFDSLNPMYTNMWFSTNTQQLWNCWAWVYDDKNVAHPYLVTEIPTIENGGISADFKTITMKLRDDIKWSDGEPITADDFVFTYKMWVDSKNTVSSTYPYDKLESVEAPDKQTVVMKFTDPFAPWQATLWKGLLPAHILQPVFDKDGTLNNAAWNSAPTVGCGPYVFKEWQSGSFADFVTNDNFWLDKPKIGEVFIRFVPDDASMVKALQAGDGDLGAFIPYSDVPTLKNAGITLVTEPSGYNEGLFFMINDKLSNPGMLDLRVRQALAMSINLDKLNQDLHFGLTKPPASYWDALPFWNNPPMQNYTYDPEGAKKLLDEAGWKDSNGDGIREKDGKDLVLRWGTTIREDRQNVQAIAQQEWAAVGIKLEITSYESDVFFADFANNGPASTGKLDIQEWSDTPAFPDPDIYYWLCSEIPSADSPSGTNSFHLCDPELDALIQKQTTQLDTAERQKTIEQINQIFHDKVYWLGLWQDPDVWAYNSKLQNVKFSGVTPFFNITEWDITQ